ncbi:GTP 3',8-cyclase MoaA [Flavihumibacter sp. ZG627]|uniref:GTP 3',8-cyclase MoaA n=1 Tax=Flavihumibacter sp. ZG627 TaxID=1463156 RepID=UPI00057C3963|nr:GTP 3',8-cyclase MoaA [Flavihumibacter sp. ZG627]KIC91521.1 molybdenum cofactor biosynthesis protein MoeA [Flavihumibacter sp. ZG627]
MEKKLTDTFGRVHNYLRISLTDNCNFRCFYCMPEEEYDFAPASRLMQASEINTISKLFVAQGVEKIRLTGGEPLVRKDAAEIILSLSELPVKLTMTTNGSRIHEYLSVLKEAGIRSLNISLDTLNREKFLLVTRRDQFQRVYDNIHLLLNEGFHVKVNMVVMKGMNDMEINDFVEWTKHEPVHVRFIEFMPFSGNRWTSNKVVTLDHILQEVGNKYPIERLQGEPNETAKKFVVPGHAGTFAVISTMSANFCGSCNRIRLTADGKLKNCLFSQHETDLLTALRSRQDILPLIMDNIKAKAKEYGGQFHQDFENIHPEDIHNRSMITIGG